MEHKKIAEGVLEAVGGKENVRSATHCMTRLRLVLKDEGKSSDEKIKAVQGVIQVVHAGDQVQIIIGPGVDMVYDEFCAVSGLEKAAVIEENLDAPKEKLTIKTVLNNMMGALSGCITPALPVFMVAGIFKMIAVLLGPSNVGLIPEGSDLLTLCNLVSDAGYYFLPFIIAYSSAKKFNCSPVLAMTLVSVALHPTMMEIVAAGEGFSIYGIPMVLVNYRQAVIPVIIMVWAMSKVEKLVKKIVPAILRTLGVPVLTIAIMLPIGYCLCGPICNVVMGWVANLIIWMTNTIGIFAIVVVAATWSLCIVFGMHIPVMMTLLPVWMEMGYDAIVSPAACAGLFAGLGIQLAYALRANGQENRALGWSCFVTNFTANVSEPYVYGIYLRDRHAFAWHTLGAMAGAGVMGLIGAKITMFTGVGFPILNVLRFGEYAVQGTIGCAVAFVVAIVLGFIFGFDKTEEKA